MNLFARACLLTSIAILPFACSSDDSSSDSTAQEAGASCGNHTREGTEECDGADLGSATCESATMSPGSTGTLGCTVDCSFDTTNCAAPSTASGGASSGGAGATSMGGTGMGGTSMGGTMGGGGMPSGGSTGDASTGADGSDTSDSGTFDGG